MAENRIVLGYDLSREFIQISYMQLGSFKPETFSFRSDKEVYNMPLKLCKRKGVNQWYVGEEAIAMAASGEGIMVDSLYEKAMRAEQIIVTDDEVTEYKASDLLGLFIKKSFSPMGFVLGGQSIEALVVTVDTFDEDFLSVLKEATANLKIDKECIFFQSHEESMYYYTIHQPKELWSYQVGLFDFSDTYLKSYRIVMNHKTKPIVTKIRKSEYTQLKKVDEKLSIMQKDAYLSQLDEDFLAMLEEFVEGEIVTSIYLIGDGFAGEWYQKSLGFLCKNRRVFGGDNLYSRGAALAAAEKLSPSVISSEYVLLGKEKLQANIGIELMNGDELVYEPLLDAGCGWHEAKSELDFMMMEGSTVELLITPVIGLAPRKILIPLPEFEKRPKGTVRLHMSVFMTAPSAVTVEIRDMGFGDFFTPLDKVWTKQILIGDSDE